MAENCTCDQCPVHGIRKPDTVEVPSELLKELTELVELNVYEDMHYSHKTLKRIEVLLDQAKALIAPKEGE